MINEINCALMDPSMVSRAKQIATIYHEGQSRKKTNQPYIIHPGHVTRLLEKFGAHDEQTLAIGWLHDTVEDTVLTCDDIEKEFGYEIAKGVYFLTRDVDREAYKSRLLDAPVNVQKVKLCDTLDNIVTLDALSADGIKRKIDDCEEFYIPLAKKIMPNMVLSFEKYLNRYKASYY